VKLQVEDRLLLFVPLVCFYVGSQSDDHGIFLFKKINFICTRIDYGCRSGYFLGDAEGRCQEEGKEECKMFRSRLYVAISINPLPNPVYGSKVPPSGAPPGRDGPEVLPLYNG
jgi:hypothetical protein